MFAVLPILKPRGVTSRRAIDAVERRIPGKIGHAGTLDPLASGVLLAMIGPATRLVPYAQRLAKSYVARYQLGLESPSDDAERECRPVEVDPIPDEATLRRVISSFIGETVQVPPRFSAVKVSGQRAYRLAKRGGEFQIGARPITIHSIDLLAYQFPEFELDVACGSGTYLRSLGRDIAAHLGTKCVMTTLCRTSVGPYDLERCASLEQIRYGIFDDKLVNPLELLAGIPKITLSAERVEQLARGVKCEISAATEHSEAVAVDAKGRLQAILRPTDGGTWRPALNFAHYWHRIDSQQVRTTPNVRALIDGGEGSGGSWNER